ICLLPPRKSSIKNLDLNISILNISSLFHFGTFCCRSKRFSTFVSMRKRRREGEEEGRRWKGGGGSEVEGIKEEEGRRWNESKKRRVGGGREGEEEGRTWKGGGGSEVEGIEEEEGRRWRRGGGCGGENEEEGGRLEVEGKSEDGRK
ncbi:hypothetical protein LINPERHAP2_LOCUS4953, partial [Linum perenne]